MCFDKCETAVQNAVERNLIIPLPGNIFMSKNPSGHPHLIVVQGECWLPFERMISSENWVATGIVLRYFPIRNPGLQILA